MRQTGEQRAFPRSTDQSGEVEEGRGKPPQVATEDGIKAQRSRLEEQ